MIFTSPFGQWVAQRRKSLGMTQADLAQATGYSLSAIRRIESGNLRPSRELSDRLAVALDIPPAERAEFLAVARGLETRLRISNVPMPASPILGRQDDLGAAVMTLERVDVRLLTLTGPPGVGKTRLAIEVARSLDSEFADGVCFVALAPLASPDRVGVAILESLGRSAGDGEAVVDTLAKRLAERRLLLVLDNFEHLIPAAPLVAELLARTPRVKVLVTSRISLHIGGEYIHEVSPLPVPDPNRLPSAGRLSSYPAVDLFVQRAQQVKPQFLVTEANAYAVAWLCHSLDGLPLAIELAASRLRAFTPQTIMTRLDHHLGSRLQLLTVARKDLPPRQQTLSAAIDWSYSLLSPEEQRMFLRLGVFVGGCTLEAIHAVCEPRVSLDSSSVSLAQFAQDDGSHLSETVDLVQSLVDKSLVQQVESKDGEGRYTMLETIREYSLERLEAGGEAESLRRRHARYFARKCELNMNSPEWPIVCTGLLKQFARESDNLQAALRWSKEHDDELALHLWISTIVGWVAHVARWYLGFRGDRRAARAEIEWSLQHNPGIGPELRSISLQVLGMLLFNPGDFDEAARVLKEALDISLGAGALLIAASAAHLCGHCAFGVNDLELSERYFAQEKELGEQTGSQGWVLNGLSMLGRIALERSDFEHAAGLLEQALALARMLGIKTDFFGGQAVVLQDLGLLAYEQGEYAKAYDLGSQALRLFEEEGEMTRHYAQHLYQGRAALALQRADLAEQHIAESLRIGREYGMRPLQSLTQLAEIAAQRGDWARCTRLMGAATSLRAVGWTGYGLSAHEHRRCLAAIAVAEGQRSGDPAFAAAWAEGQAMTVEQAIDAALASL